MFIEKASATVAYGGGTAAVYFGLTAGEWQVVGVIGGIVIGIAGLGVNYWFKHQHLKLARERLEMGDE